MQASGMEEEITSYTQGCKEEDNREVTDEQVTPYTIGSMQNQPWKEVDLGKFLSLQETLETEVVGNDGLMSGKKID